MEPKQGREGKFLTQNFAALIGLIQRSIQVSELFPGALQGSEPALRGIDPHDSSELGSAIFLQEPLPPEELMAREMVAESASHSTTPEDLRAKEMTPEELQADRATFAETPPHGTGETQEASSKLDSDSLAAIAQDSLKHPSLHEERVLLNRSSYKIHHTGDLLPPDVEIPSKGKPPLDSDDSPFKTWSLYNYFATEIDKRDKGSWPPPNVLLQDWHVWKVLESGISKSNMHKHWPADFNSVGVPYTRRKPKGRAAKVEDPKSGKLHYVVITGLNGSTKLHGDEGALDSWVVVKEEDAEVNPGGNWFMGSECRIQVDEALSDQELTLGVKMSRYPVDRLPSNTPTPVKKKRTSSGQKINKTSNKAKGSSKAPGEF